MKTSMQNELDEEKSKGNDICAQLSVVVRALTGYDPVAYYLERVAS